MLTSRMRGAYVVQLRRPKGGANQLEGSVEEVDTGKQLHFQTEDELVGFLRKRFIQACRSLPDSEEQNDPSADRL